MLSGRVLRGPARGGPRRRKPTRHVGLVYEAPRPAYSEPLGPTRPLRTARAANEGLGIFGGVATTEVPTPQTARARSGRPSRGVITDRRDVEPADRHAAPRGERRGGGREEAEPVRTGCADGGGPAPPADEQQPRVSVRDLPPDVQLRFWRLRVIIMVVVGVVFGGPHQELGDRPHARDTRRDRGHHPPVAERRRCTSTAPATPAPASAPASSCAKMRREGYFALDARPIPNSREFIDHLVVGPDRRLRHRLGEVGPQAADQDLERQEAVPRAPSRRRTGSSTPSGRRRRPARSCPPRSAPRSRSGPRSPSTVRRSRGTSPRSGTSTCSPGRRCASTSSGAAG